MYQDCTVRSSRVKRRTCSTYAQKATCALSTVSTTWNCNFFWLWVVSVSFFLQLESISLNISAGWKIMYHTMSTVHKCTKIWLMTGFNHQKMTHDWIQSCWKIVTPRLLADMTHSTLNLVGKLSLPAIVFSLLVDLAQTHRHGGNGDSNK